MSVAQPIESPFDHNRYFTFSVEDETYNGSIHFLTHYAEKPAFVEVLRNAFFRDETYGDNRADWHRNTTSFYAWVKAHILRLAWDCREKFLCYFLRSSPNVCRDFGFPVAHDRAKRILLTLACRSKVREPRLGFPHLDALVDDCSRLVQQVLKVLAHRYLLFPNKQLMDFEIRMILLDSLD